ncbi:MAG TPA: prepilin-type cleavage/methylation domain-containing protein, partial [Gammaproteobacteria bacterium]|nr:prepilin-type cleavage/methylation domain-containing protein [Gammaproteobacteria bacterium]
HSGEYVSQVSVASNVVTITFGSGVHNGNTITLTATDQGGSISWACASATISDNQLPTICTGI